MINNMKMRLQFYIFVFLLCILPCCSLANVQKDSLLDQINNSKNDTVKINALNALAWSLKNSDPDTSILLSKKALEFSEKINWLLGIGKSRHSLGACHWLKGDLSNSLQQYYKALEVWEKIERSAASGVLPTESDMILDLKSKTLNNIGVVYYNQANYPKSLEFYLKALKIAEMRGDKNGIGVRLGNIGSIYRGQGDYQKALDNYFRALKIMNELGNKQIIANNLGNIGGVYYSQGDHSKALDYYSQTLSKATELDDQQLISNTLGNIGAVYMSKKEYPRALDNYLKALQLSEELGDKVNIANWLTYIGALYTLSPSLPSPKGESKKGLALSEYYLKKALNIAENTGDREGIKEADRYLFELYKKKGDFTRAVQYYKRYITTKDSISNSENTRKQTQSEMQFDFDKQQTADSIKNVEIIKQEELKHDQEITQQRIYTYGGGIGFLLMLVVAGVSFRAYKQKQKATEIILYQKHLVEEKQKEILDSIHYANRIQRSLLPSEKYFEKCLRINR